MHSRPQCVLLVGAPTNEDLAWEEDRLLRNFEHPFKRLLEGEPGGKEQATDSSFVKSTRMPSKWRSITLDPNNVYAAGEKDASPQTQFISFLGDGQYGDKNEHTDFLEHSIAVIDDLASSQILPGGMEYGVGQNVDTTIDFSTSFATTSATDSSMDITGLSFGHRPPTEAQQQATFDGNATNLKQIPSADYITTIAPQTVTVNLIVGLISVSPARTVRLKRSRAEMDIIEIIVGDETRAGFTITFWLAPVESQNKPADDLRGAIQDLRAGDVILLQNVALSCFRNCVYGQSLSKRFARNSTLVAVLEEGAMPILQSHAYAKAQRVKKWIGDFVGKEKKTTALPASKQPRPGIADALPPDTQD